MCKWPFGRLETLGFFLPNVHYLSFIMDGTLKRKYGVTV